MMRPAKSTTCNWSMKNRQWRNGRNGRSAPSPTTAVREPLPKASFIYVRCRLFSDLQLGTTDKRPSLLSRNFIVKGPAEGRVWQLSFSGEGSAIERICFRRTGHIYPRILHRI